MKAKLLLIIPTTLLFIAAAVWAVDFARVIPPAGELHIVAGPESPHLFVLENTGDVPFQYWGFSKNDAGLTAKFVDPSLKMPVFFGCGTGIEQHTLAAGESVEVYGLIPKDGQIGEPVIVECYVSTAGSGWDNWKRKLIDKFPSLNRHLTFDERNSIQLASPEFTPETPEPELKTAEASF